MGVIEPEVFWTSIVLKLELESIGRMFRGSDDILSQEFLMIVV